MHGVDRWVLGVAAFALLIPCDARGGSTGGPVSADECLAAAVEATLDESPGTGRDALLRAGLELDPDHAALRAERGEVLQDGRWLPVWYAQHLASEDPRLEAYRERLAAAKDTPDDHARLANWCEREGLANEARTHWLRVLESEPEHRAALRGLNAQWSDEQLWDKDLLEESLAEAARAKKALHRWSKRVSELEGLRGGRDAVEMKRFANEMDHYAAGVVADSVCAPRLDDEQATRQREALGDVLLAEANRLPEPEVTAVIARMAVAAASPRLRYEASKALANRPESDAIPLLLSRLQPLLESKHQIGLTPEGLTASQHEVTLLGEDVERSLVRRRLAGVSLDNIGRLNSRQAQTAIDAARLEALRSEARFRSETQRIQSQVSQHNVAAGADNGHVYAALSELTGRDLGEDPRAWWDYWQEYSGYEVPTERPRERRYDDSVSIDRSYVPPPTPRCECFVAGTPVWTRTGKQPIEQLRPGDLVLARDPDRGGLCFRAVTDTSLRQPRPLLAITAGGETIRTTTGHPFWVVGQGWRMAKQLGAGDLVSAVDGPVRIDAISSIPGEPTHNLVVEGVGNYYVGEAGVLVHDLTPRRPSVGLLTLR